jgi:D-alanyl-D-alanine carboxypeptidase
MLKLKSLVASGLIFCLSYLGYLLANSNKNTVIAQSPSTQSQTAPNKLSSTELQEVLNNAVKTQNIPGAVMYLSTPKGQWLGASGVSKLETKTPMKTSDGFSIASMSKTFVSVIVLKLVEAKKLNLDSAIAKYLSADIAKHITNSEIITVRQLLNNSSGIAEYLDTNSFKEATAKRSRSQPWTAREAIKYIYDADAQGAPGNKFIYTDSNYILLELIVENVTKNTLAYAIRTTILQPLGLKNTFTELREPIRGNPATGYGDRNKDGKLDSYAEVNDGNGLGDGSLVASAENLAKFTQALFAKKTLLSPKMLKEMLVLKDEKEIGNGYGLGVEKFATPYGQFIGHTGTAYGFVTLMAYSPSRNTTIVLLLNNQNANVKAIAFQAAGIAFQAKGK